MNPEWVFAPGSEPERYEFDEIRAAPAGLGRREFLSFIGGGVVVLLLAGRAAAQESGGGRRRRGPGEGPQDVAAWIHIDEDGRVTGYTGKAEVGQNIRTSLIQAIAEELRTPAEAIRLVMADTQLVPYDAGTFGSRTTPDMARQLHRAAAAVRELLFDLAAAALQADRASLSVEEGRVVNHATGQTATFGALTKGRKLAKAITDDARLATPEHWLSAGRSLPKVEGRAFVTGAHEYPSDMQLPGMWHGKVLRPPAFGAKPTSVDTADAAAMADTAVVREGDFIGVAAPTEHAATQALRAIKTEWQTSPQRSDTDLFERLRGGGRTGAPAPSIPPRDDEVSLEATYTAAYIAHAPLEPRAAVAEWTDGKLTVWTGTQRPFGVREDLAGAFRLNEADVRVIVPDTGSGYGGKHTSEAAVEAARLARGANRPVKLVWTRTEEFTWAYFRPAGVIDVRSRARKDGLLLAWDFHNYNSGGSGIRGLYEAAEHHTEFHNAESPLRQGSYRGLAATANHFARECHMDELAHALGVDPLQFRLKNLKDPRQRAVLEAATQAFGWGGKAAAGSGFGLAAGFEKGGYLATCAEVAVSPKDGAVKVVRALSAFECGAVVNPAHLKNQIAGAMLMGLGGALFEAIRFAEGRILNASFGDYRVPRFSDAPEIEVVLVDRKDLPSAGAGETPIVGIAPAIGNAIFAATGRRLRSLPMAPNGVKG